MDILPPFPLHGVRLNYLTKFLSLYNSNDELSNQTTTEVCESLVKKLTGPLQCSYCELLLSQEEEKENVEIANVFISHAWKFQFLDVIEAIQDHFQFQSLSENKESIVIWFDVFSNNQHKAIDFPFNWWCNTFKNAIATMNHTVMILSPWNDPIPLTRAWCIWELYCTIDTKSKFEIVMPKEQKYQFIEGMANGINETINLMLSKINSEKSEAWKKEDETKIHEVVRSQVGFSKLNSLIFDRMRAWVIQIAQEALHMFLNDPNPEVSHIDGSKSLLAALFRGQGKYPSAESLYKEVLESKKIRFGENHIAMIEINNSLAIVYKDQGKYALAEELYLKTLELCRMSGKKDDLLAVMNNLAVLYDYQSKYADSERLYKECIELAKNDLGEDHLDTLGYMNNLGLIYTQLQKYDLAESLHQTCSEKSSKRFGSNHPEAIKFSMNLGVFYKRCNKMDLALPIFQEVYEKRITILGLDHPETLSSLCELAECYDLLGNITEAESKYQDCVTQCRQLWGLSSTTTLRCINALAILYDQKGNFVDAEPLYVEILEATRNLYGELHSMTLEALNNLSINYKNQKKYTAAVKLFSNYLQTNFKENNNDTKEDILNLPLLVNTWFYFAEFYRSVNDFLSARPLYLKCLEKGSIILSRDDPIIIQSYVIVKLLEEQIHNYAFIASQIRNQNVLYQEDN